MKIVWMNGGLGNQLFQYIFYRFLEETTGDVCYIDDRFFFHESAHNGYELKRIFNLKVNLLSDFFEPDLWEEVLDATRKKVNIVDYLRLAGLELQLLTEGNTYQERYKNMEQPFNGKSYSLPMNQYTYDVVKIEGNLYYHGYWINMNWFKYMREFILQELTFPQIQDDENDKKMNAILNCHSVAVHVRRGDFVALGWNLGAEWYAPAVTSVRQSTRNPKFFLFSDDIAWCKEHMQELGFIETDTIFFMEGNTGINNYRDMQLMSHCQDMIIANSTFSYLAALLNQSPNKCILNPMDGIRKII